MAQLLYRKYEVLSLILSIQPAPQNLTYDTHKRNELPSTSPGSPAALKCVRHHMQEAELGFTHRAFRCLELRNDTAKVLWKSASQEGRYTQTVHGARLRKVSGGCQKKPW